MARIERDPAPLVLDAGCGTGLSTARLAALHPEAWVIGVDRSAARLARQGAAEQLIQRGRALWLRADLVDVYRLARRAGLQLHAHYLLYPNPYPKPAQLRRRWQGHPVFFDLIALGGALSLRSNWWVYVKEWEQALRFAGVGSELSQLGWQAQPLSPFEAKYQASGHALWQLRASLGPGQVRTQSI